MRAGDTQDVPTNVPNIYLEIQTPSPEDVSSRIVKHKLDEQLYGGIYEIWLNNSDSALASKDYAGYRVDLRLGFSGGTRSQWHDLWVDTQEFSSDPGKLLMKLTCIDAWGLLARINASVGAQYWNYPELAPGEPDADATYYDKVIKAIITSIIQTALDATFAIDDDDSETYFNALKPPIRVNNARTAIFQLMSMTEAYLLYRNDEDFHVIKPSDHSSVYTFALGDDEFWMDSEQSAIAIPNRVIFHGTDSGGNLIDSWDDTNKYGLDATSYSRIGIYIDEHFYSSRAEIELMSDQTLLENLAQAAIAKIQGERNQGILVAPMHCSLELLDKITITDIRYSGTKTITGYVHRMIREYEANKGIYRITVFLGGVASGYTPDGATPPIRKSQDPSPPMSADAFTLAPAFLPIVVDIAFTADDWNDISWAAGTIKTAAGHSFTINLGSLHLDNSNPYYLYYDTRVDDGDLDSTQTFTDTVSHERLLVAFVKKGATYSDKALIVAGTSGEDLFIDKLSAIAADLGLITAGEIRVGTGTLGSNFTGWRLWVESSIGVMAGYNDDDIQWYSDTDGKLYAGGGAVTLDEKGITVEGDLHCHFIYNSTDIGFIEADNTTEFEVVAYVVNDVDLILYSGEDLHLKAYADMFIDVEGGDLELDVNGEDIHPSVPAGFDLGTNSYYVDVIECVTLDDSHSPAPNIKDPLQAIRQMKETVRKLTLDDIKREKLGKKLLKEVRKAGGTLDVPWKDKGSFPPEILNYPDEEDFAKRDKIYDRQVVRRDKMARKLAHYREMLTYHYLSPVDRAEFELKASRLGAKLAVPLEKPEPTTSTNVFAEIWMMIRAIQRLADRVDELEAR